MNAPPASVRAIDARADRDTQRVSQLAAQGRDTTTARVVLVRADSVVPEGVNWLWPDWLAVGKLHLIAGAPGTGKTTLALTLAATVSVGGCWPDGTPAPLGDVAIWSGEDGLPETLVPRLIAAGAELSRIHFVGGMRAGNRRYPFDPARDIEALRVELAAVPNLVMIIIDPVVSAVAGDSHKNAEVRRGLQPLVDLARDRHAALLGVTHFSKGTTGSDPVERITGSVAYGALARVVIVTAKQQASANRPERRLFLSAKSNLGPDGGGFAYGLEPCEVPGKSPGHPMIATSVVRWGEAIQGSARDALAQAEWRGDEGGSASVRFLRKLLADGPVASDAVYAAAEEVGFSKDQMKRASARLGVKPNKVGMTSGWERGLPGVGAVPAGTEGSEECGGGGGGEASPSTD